MNPRFILPPHPFPEMKIRRQDLSIYEGMGKWVAQRKFNGTHVVIWIYEDSVMMWDRRGTPLTLYKLTPSMRNCLLSLQRNKSMELILCGELLHTKAKSKITKKQMAKDTIVLFDSIYYGDHLTNMSQIQRLEFLYNLCGCPHKFESGAFLGATKRALVVCEDDISHLWLAETFNDEFLYHFDECLDSDKYGRDKYPEIEGLMLRLKDSRLRHGGSGEVDWLLRCRKSKNNIYNF